jgi:DNA-binding SARP family transcriptional activator
MEFKVLGPLEVHSGERTVDLAPKRRHLLALLLCRPNAVISTDRLVHELWGDVPPRTAKKSLQVHLHNLRRRLNEKDRIIYHPPGYAVNIEPGELDIHRFESLINCGRSAVAGTQIRRGAEAFRQALALWRGPAFVGHEHLQCIAEEANRLTESRRIAEEDLLDIDLQLGRHAEIVGRLRVLVEQNPFRERLRGQLMLALHRLHRSSEALRVYSEGRQILAEELGLDPGNHLRLLERAILNNDPALNARGMIQLREGVAYRPREIPADIDAFTGRVQDVTRIEKLLTTREGDGSKMALIYGAGGAGKSTLAVRAAHNLSNMFPDGQLYVDLQGTGNRTRPLEPREVLHRFLRSLGAGASRIPKDTAEAAVRYRSLLADRRMLIFLDNAANSAQVLPLLPGTTSCATLVTSRRTLAEARGIEADRAHHLGEFSDEDALSLLRAIIGNDRVASESADALKIIQLCGRLPLAVRIAGAKLAARPMWTLRVLSERLSPETRRLDELQMGDMSIRATIGVSYTDIEDPYPDQSARMFRLLGLLKCSKISVSTAAVLADVTVDRALSALERLTDASLLESCLPGHYRMSDLVRLFAQEQAATSMSEAEMRAAVSRIPTPRA